MPAMRNIFILSVIAICLTIAGFSQDAIMMHTVDSLAIADSTFRISHLPDSITKRISTVYDNYWVTNSIKSGWKTTDTALIGTGLELCDTVHPFVRPTIGKLWRGCTYYHAGWDIGLDYGSPVLAGLNGKVRYARYCSGYGNLVIVRHYSGMEVYYAHLSKILVKTDQWVEPGDTLGLGGATGHARGNHLHMEFRICDRALDIADLYVLNDTVVDLYKIKDLSVKQIQPQTAEYHKVVSGDTLSGIARRYGTTVTNLCTLNNISRETILQIGWRLRVR
jgi:murein DD-endopeptidase MepM/ murein hydrolase activator NlpD